MKISVWHGMTGCKFEGNRMGKKLKVGKERDRESVLGFKNPRKPRKGMSVRPGNKLVLIVH
jgi:hypothetical protein